MALPACQRSRPPSGVAGSLLVGGNYVSNCLPQLLKIGVRCGERGDQIGACIGREPEHGSQGTQDTSDCDNPLIFAVHEILNRNVRRHGTISISPRHKSV
jgi:hypothetical protein